MSATTKNEKLSTGDSPVCGKSRGNRLARRARSFKEDFLEIISQMRSPGGSATRSGSPCSPKNRAKGTDLVDGNVEKNPSKDLECHVRQAQFALKHFRDVISKNKLEMLPGNGTVVLETVTAIHVLLKKYVLNEQSSTLVSATNQVYQSVAKLIKLCDDYLLIGDKALNKENVTEVVNQVEGAIQNLVSLTKDKLAVRDSTYKLSTDALTNHVHKPRTLSDKGALDIGQRSSLPDIPLTPREREILEQTSAFVLERHSQSTENVLRDSPPPKPPHPDRVHLDASFPPPLPPKKRQKQLEDLCGIKNSIECLSLRSKSPEDSSSLLSASGGSLDSVLNHSREEEEMRVLLDDSDRADDGHHQHYHHNGSSQSCCWDSSSTASTDHIRLMNSSGLSDSRRDSPVFAPDITVPDNAVAKLDRLSGSQAESGFCSMPSRRSSCQSYSTSSQQLSSTRSSQLSYTSQEFHHTERKIISSTDTTNSHKYQTSYSNGSKNQSHKLVSNSVSSEKLSYQKKTYYKRCSETSNNEFWSSVNDSPCKRLQDIPCCHNEIKIHECQLHAAASAAAAAVACMSSPKNSPKQLSPVHGNISPIQDDDLPPALPEKQRTKRERHPSLYDNMTEGGVVEATHERSCVMSQSHTVVEDGVVNHKQSSLATQNCSKMENIGNVTNFTQVDRVDGMVLQSKTADGITEQSGHRIGCAVFQSQNLQSADGKPPPLPPKKKHIMAYMEMFGNASHANTNEFLRHSVHTYNLHQSEWQQHEKILTSTQSCSFIVSSHSDHNTPVKTLESKILEKCLPPALPPKRSRTRSAASSPPTTPFITSEDSKKVDVKTEAPRSPNRNELIINEEIKSEPISNSNSPSETLTIEADLCPEISLLDKLEVSQFLVLKKPEDEGPDIRGGHPDALVIHATKAHKNDFLYQEAFLTTYRTFMTPLELIQKLCYRHDRFINSQDSLKQRAARESFSLLVRVVSDLTLSDLDQVVLQSLMEFVQQLLCRGDLTMAKALRVILLTKHAAKKEYMLMNTLLPSHNIYTRQSVLLDFKSEQIAEQMTLLDAELFMKIEIPEVLIWAQEQNEERSPNLTRFTEHFNKMSYWARSRILEQNEAKDRERYVVKFIKIMKHLRKINNFNSYLALLSALDSAPIRRLEWQKHITEGLKEYCALIDSSSSFRAYRQALAETQPPCIPYIGLVLQDLTFVHIGNTNLLPDGGINFSKRWQQFNIVENMKRFKKGHYPYKKNERIIAFFNGFDESLSEEAMWQISEKIKPRGGKKT